MLLRRLWQYDRQIAYNGFKHIYTLKQNGENITLVPVSPESREMVEESLVVCEKKVLSLNVPLQVEGKTTEEYENGRPTPQRFQRSNYNRGRKRENREKMVENG